MQMIRRPHWLLPVCMLSGHAPMTKTPRRPRATRITASFARNNRLRLTRYFKGYARTNSSIHKIHSKVGLRTLEINEVRLRGTGKSNCRLSAIVAEAHSEFYRLSEWPNDMGQERKRKQVSRQCCELQPTSDQASLKTY
jgi:hypothetical protein